MSEDNKPEFLDYVPDEFERRPFAAVLLFVAVIAILIVLALGGLAYVASVFGPEWVTSTLDRLIFGATP